MKLYIPTTTLNFNNILSSETISPKAFYERRGYGYKRWVTVAENCLENGILLYKKPFSFTRPDNGLDDYPMLIELEMDEGEVAELEPCGDWGYKSRHSLALTPVTTRFIFFLEEHKRIALSKSETSAETKLTRLYGGRLNVKSYTEDTLKYDVSDFDKPDNEGVESDKRQNKIKGFAYGYIIGRILSRTDLGVKRLNARYSVRDIVASVISSGEGITTKEQEEMLGKDLLMFDDLYVYWLEKHDKKLADEFYSDLEKTSLGYHSKRKEWLTYLIKSLSVKEKWEELQQWIVKAITKTEAERVNDYNIFTEDGQPEIAVMHGKLTKINSDVEYIREYETLVNDVFTSDKYNGKVSTFRMELAEDVTDCVIADYGDRWQDSEIRTYLNAMRHYVGGEAFTQPWTDGVLSSITAVIMKGEDWEGLFRFMVSKGMCDYRYAFGLYGALNGFANLTRDFTDILFASENKQYTWNVYKEIHRQLTGVELHEALDDVDIPLPEDIKESKISQGEPIKKVVNTLGDMKTLFESKGVKSIKGDKLKKFEHAYYDASGDYEAMLEVLKSERGWKDDCRRLLKDVGKLPNKVSKVVKEQQQRTIEPSFDFQIEPSKDCDFYNDVRAYDYIYPLLNTPEELKQMRIDLSWFQNNYKDEYLDSEKGQYKKGRYCDKPNDNKSVLEHWENFLWRKKTKGMDREQKIYAHVDIDRIISELKNIYLK